MSLLKLLSVGHSFVGMNGERGRFKMTQENLLPRFAPLRCSYEAPEQSGPKTFQASSAIPQSGGNSSAGSTPVSSRQVSSSGTAPLAPREPLGTVAAAVSQGERRGR